MPEFRNPDPGVFSSRDSAVAEIINSGFYLHFSILNGIRMTVDEVRNSSGLNLRIRFDAFSKSRRIVPLPAEGRVQTADLSWHSGRLSVPPLLPHSHYPSTRRVLTLAQHAVFEAANDLWCHNIPSDSRDEDVPNGPDQK